MTFTITSTVTITADDLVENYTMTIGDSVLDLATCSADDVYEMMSAHDMERRDVHYRSDRIQYKGDFGHLQMVSPFTGESHCEKENTIPATPYEAWVVAQLVRNQDCSPALAWLASQQAVVLTAHDAKKLVKTLSGSIDGIHLHEFHGDIDHFHETLAEEAEAYGITDEYTDDVTDKDLGLAFLKRYAHESSFYTDGFWMYEVTPY